MRPQASHARRVATWLVCAVVLVAVSFTAALQVTATGASPPPAPEATAAAEQTWHFDPPARPVDTSAGECARGVDVDATMGSSSGGEGTVDAAAQFRCLHELGYGFAIVRLALANEACTLTPAARETVLGGWAAGMREVHIQVSPSHLCPMSVAAQAAAVLEGLNATGAIFTRAWLDVEPHPEAGWSENHEVNEQHVRLALDSMSTTLGPDRVGVSSSFFGWPRVVGDSVQGFDQYALRYAAPDSEENDANSADDEDETAGNMNGGVGGWRRGSALVTQYQADAKVCGLVVGLNARNGDHAQCEHQHLADEAHAVLAADSSAANETADEPPLTWKTYEAQLESMDHGQDMEAGIEFAEPEQQQQQQAPATNKPFTLPPAAATSALQAPELLQQVPGSEWIAPHFTDDLTAVDTAAAFVKTAATAPSKRKPLRARSSKLRRVVPAADGR